MMLKNQYLLASSLLSAAFCLSSATGAWADSVRHGVSGKSPAPVEEVQVPNKVQAATTPANPSIVGLVKSYEGNNLQLRLSDGTEQSYSVDPAVAGATEIRQGTFVSLDMDNQGQVKALETAEVDKVYDGTIGKIENDQVTLNMEDGTAYTTTISPATISRMGLESGSPLKVTTYRGTQATKVCLGQKATPAETPVAAPPPVAPPPEPVGGGELEPTPALPPQPRALW